VPEVFATTSDPPMNEDGHVSISRRGLLAAGLTAAVIGSVGAVSIFSANADDAPPAPPAASTDATDAGAAVEAPPSLLPWGTEPKELDTGTAGATSAQVAAEGADVAPKDTSGSLVPDPEWAPKGRSWRTGGVQEETTSVQPPTPPASGVLAEDPVPVTDNPVNFFYNVGSQIGDSDGAYANLVIGKPHLASGDYHTLAEISVQSADSQQIVEVGWNVDRTVNGDSDPHLFVYHWVDRTESCYNACGWKQYSQTTKPGDTLPVGYSKRFGIQHANGGWWVAYDTEWIGYFPDDLWGGNYTRSGLQQFFGEVAASSLTPCTDMGNGITAYDYSAARIGSITQLNGPEPKVLPRSIGGVYPVLSLSDRTFRYGGPGVC
jgi:Neprosin